MERQTRICSVFYLAVAFGVLAGGVAGCVERKEQKRYDRLLAQSVQTKRALFRQSDIFPPALKTTAQTEMPAGLGQPSIRQVAGPSGQRPLTGGPNPPVPSSIRSPMPPPVERTLTGAITQTRGAQSGIGGPFWTVQVGAFSAQPNAERKLAGFRQTFCGGGRSDPAVCGSLQVVCSDLRFEGRVYRVRLGQFRDARTAQGYCAGLGHDCWTARVDAPQQPACRT
ncbi:MAG: SPOR domain-containing protein [Alphaproteobacteria bacterium]